MPSLNFAGALTILLGGALVALGFFQQPAAPSAAPAVAGAPAAVATVADAGTHARTRTAR